MCKCMLWCFGDALDISDDEKEVGDEDWARGCGASSTSSSSKKHQLKCTLQVRRKRKRVHLKVHTNGGDERGGVHGTAEGTVKPGSEGKAMRLLKCLKWIEACQNSLFAFILCGNETHHLAVAVVPHAWRRSG